MKKEEILKLIKLKVKLMKAEEEHEKEIEEAVTEDSWAFAEGYVSDSMEKIEHFGKEIEKIKEWKEVNKMYLSELTNFYAYLSSKLNPDEDDIELKKETKKRILEELKTKEIKD